MGYTSVIYFESGPIYVCSCQTHLTRFDLLESRKYQASTGSAYLFTKV